MLEMGHLPRESCHGEIGEKREERTCQTIERKEIEKELIEKR